MRLLRRTALADSFSSIFYFQQSVSLRGGGGPLLRSGGDVGDVEMHGHDLQPVEERGKEGEEKRCQGEGRGRG